MKNAHLFFRHALIIGLLLTLAFPWMHLSALIPPLVFLFYRKSRVDVLCVAIALGLTLDLFAQQTRFGLYTLNYFITAGYLYERRNLLFEDSPWTYPVLTTLFACFSTMLMFPLRLALDRPLPYSLKFFLTDIIVLPFLDGLYCFALVISLILIANKMKKKRTWSLKRPK